MIANGQGPEYALITADRLAKVFTTNDICRTVLDTTTGSIYMVVAAGSGANVMVPLFSSATQFGEMGVSLHEFRLVSAAGSPGAIAAIGGVGASDSAPILRAATNETLEWSWAAGNVVSLGTQLTLPTFFDGTRAVTFELGVYSGTTDKASMLVEMSFDGAVQVSATADDTASLSATVHTITATISSGVPAAPKRVTIAVTPTTAHATNAYQLVSAKLKFYKV